MDQHCRSEKCLEGNEWGECGCTCKECLAVNEFFAAMAEAQIREYRDDERETEVQDE